jgi:hypothetical protein
MTCRGKLWDAKLQDAMTTASDLIAEARGYLDSTALKLVSYTGEESMAIIHSQLSWKLLMFQSINYANGNAILLRVIG